MKNRDKWGDKVEVCKGGSGCCAVLYDGTPCSCWSIPCYNCSFNREPTSCELQLKRWLDQEYEEDIEEIEDMNREVTLTFEELDTLLNQEFYAGYEDGLGDGQESMMKTYKNNMVILTPEQYHDLITAAGLVPCENAIEGMLNAVTNSNTEEEIREHIQMFCDDRDIDHLCDPCPYNRNGECDYPSVGCFKIEKALREKSK